MNRFARNNPVDFTHLGDVYWRLGEVDAMDVREQVIAGIVRTRLAEDRRTGGQPIDVLVANGDIYLLGQIDSDDQREAAKMIVQDLVGVRQIVDNMVVRTHRTHPQLPAF